MTTASVPTTNLQSGEEIPVLGQGTWHLGEGRHDPEQEIAALRLGVELGQTLIDTAEIYGDGTSETLVGRALEGYREDVFLVSKVMPDHATFDGTIAACAASLKRLGVDQLDLYLLHWRGSVPLHETVAAFQELRQRGSIRYWGVSNFDPSDIDELLAVDGGDGAQTDQVLYNLSRRGIEWDLLPRCRQARMPVMAYSPIEQGRLLGQPALEAIAARHGATGAQVALAWLISHDGIVAIPEAGRSEHVRENRAALELELTDEDRAELDQAFPAPQGPRPLEIL